MTLDEQLAVFDRKSEQAYRRCLRSFKDRHEEILSEARKRMVASYPDYGDRSWRKGFHELRQDELEEMADCINYRVMRIAQGWPN